MKNKALIAAIFAILLCVPEIGNAQRLSVSAHFDARRATAISAVNYAVPVTEKVFLVGFVETWYNNEYAYPTDKLVLFSKSWLTYSLTKRLSLSVGLEWSRNMAGAFYRYPVRESFTDDKFYVHPKVGLKFQILK